MKLSVRAMLAMCVMMSAMTTVLVVMVMRAVTAAMFTMLAMCMLVAVGAFAPVCIRYKSSCEMLLHSLICIPLHARDELDARLGKRRLCTRADAAADDEIRLRRVKECGKCASATLVATS